MNDIKKELLKEKTQLESIITQAEKRLSNTPEGHLVIDSNSGTPRFSQVIKSPDQKKIYLGSDNLETAKALAQKGYDIKILRAAKLQLKAIEHFINSYEPTRLKDIYSSLSDVRKTLIDAEVLDDETFAAQWSQVKYPPGSFEESDPEFYTLKNERVRSKTEKNAADEMMYAEVPYRYEPPLHIVSQGPVWRPDFMVLNKRTRKEYIWEHLGKMDDPDYAVKNVRKINLYLENGFIPGDNLIITMETSKTPLSTRQIKLIIDHYFK